jgi:tetratricopeptide (TPR) repeat protein
MPAPAWLGTYTDEQRRLLAMPLDTPVETPAPTVYPDLTRFTFTGEAPLKVPSNLTSYSDLIVQALSQSPYLYVFRTGGTELGNPVALYGPTPEPEADPWKRAVAGSGGNYTLQTALPADAVRESIEKTRSLDPPKALEILKTTAPIAGASPGVFAMLGDTALAVGDAAVAESAANEALKIDPLFPAAHRILAEVFLKRADRDRAKASIIKALALYPASKRAWQVADSLAGREIVRDIGIPVPFIEVNAVGAVVVVSCDRPMCERYAGCKAAFRYESPLREAVLGEQSSVAYHLSVTEEVACIEAGLGAHLQAKGQVGKPPEPDPTAELLIRLAQSKGLTSYAMFEILGKYRPEWLRVAPQPVHDAVVAYVATRVFGAATEGNPSAPSTGVITAMSQDRATGVVFR